MRAEQSSEKAQAIAQQISIVTRFIEVYCAEHHGGTKQALCDDCADLLSYAQTKLGKCPYDPKPKCKECATHCYRPDYRERIREVMRFSGMYFVKRGRVDWLVRYFLTEGPPRLRRDNGNETGERVSALSD